MKQINQIVNTPSIFSSGLCFTSFLDAKQLLYIYTFIDIFPLLKV